MSTIDPVAREREPRYAARRRARWWGLLLLSAIVAGYGCSILGDVPGSSFSFGLGETGPVVKTALALGGLVAAMVVLGVVLRLPRASGLTGQPLFVVATTLLAFTAGVSRLARPSEGDRIPLWYDPADPGNVDKIVLGE